MESGSLRNISSPQQVTSTAARTEQNSNGSSPVSVRDTNPRGGHSPLSELLVYPSSFNKQKPAAKSYAAHVLTSAQSIAFLEKKRKKRRKGRRRKEQ